MVNGPALQFVPYVYDTVGPSQRVGVGVVFGVVRVSIQDPFACCFGGAPQPDEWIHVSMKEGSGSPYFPFVAVSVTGTLRIEGIDDGAGYAAGCFRLEGTETEEL